MAAEHVIARSDFDRLFTVLLRRGYTIVGPTVRDGAIVYDEVRCASDLPVGWTDDQDGGRYRLKRRGDQALFGYAVGPTRGSDSSCPPRSRSGGRERMSAGD